jgi:hypothetical protein
MTKMEGKFADHVANLPSMLGKNIPRRILQSCRHLRKEVSMLHTL